MEIETEVTLTEDFSKWTSEQKMTLITAIIQGKTFDFTGNTIIEIEPRDYDWRD